MDSPKLGTGKYIAAGAGKTVACVEGPKNKGAPAVIIDCEFFDFSVCSVNTVVFLAKKTPFYNSTDLLRTISEALCMNPLPTSINNYQWSVIEKFVKRLFLFVVF